MDTHFHTGIEHGIYAAVFTIVFIHVVRLAVAAPLAKRDGAAGVAGRAIGALVTF